MADKPTTMDMQDDDEKRLQRGSQPAFNPMPNRQQRRNIARKAKLFQDKSGKSWPIMNGRNVNLQTKRSEQDATDTH